MTDPCSINANCTDTQGSYECDCHIGYSGDGVDCVDIDECTDGIDDCDDEATCTNNDGSYECDCNDGKLIN